MTTSERVVRRSRPESTPEPAVRYRTAKLARFERRNRSERFGKGVTQHSVDDAGRNRTSVGSDGTDKLRSFPDVRRRVQKRVSRKTMSDKPYRCERARAEVAQPECGGLLNRQSWQSA